MAAWRSTSSRTHRVEGDVAELGEEALALDGDPARRRRSGCSADKRTESRLQQALRFGDAAGAGVEIRVDDLGNGDFGLDGVEAG